MTLPNLAQFLQAGSGGQAPSGLSNVAMTSITLGASNHTKGSYVQLAASAPWDASGVIFGCFDTGGSVDTDILADIAVGSSGNEWPVLENLRLFNHRVGGLGSQIDVKSGYYFPIYIPSGARVSARAQANNAASGKTPQLCATFLRGGAAFRGGSRVLGLGADTANTRGTSLPTTGTSAWTAWTQLEASCPADVIAIRAVLMPNLTGSAPFSGRVALDIGIGASGSEHPLVERLTISHASGNYQSNCTPYTGGWLPCRIPAGARLTARAKVQSSSYSVDVNVIVYGLVA